MTLLQSTDSKTFKKEEKKNILHIFFLFCNKKMSKVILTLHIFVQNREYLLYINYQEKQACMSVCTRESMCPSICMV